MGPLIPNGLIPTEWNFVIAILIGFAFGYILEASGFSSSRKLVGVFYGYDFAVLKVFFTAAAVAVIGLYYMDYLNWLDVSQLYVQPTYVWAAIIGGIIMGTGFVSGGYCPGTSITGVAIGKIDAIVFTIGLMIGIFGFSEFYETLEPLFARTYLGDPTLTESLGISPNMIILVFSIIAVIAFYISDKVRAKVKKVIY
ncbi:YeeE/YedE thiosulfate transporter family protein [Namhaeicola litoreus]|uniref:YeeE/YedE thiosulfate transporter family protein n=1 Tax=Namhaeicola litoreus TaxID=1052145 RepID=A0ABW3Y303_9FLAO